MINIVVYLLPLGEMPVFSEETRSQSGIEAQRTLSEEPTSKLTEIITKNGLRIIVDERPGSTTVHCSIIVSVGSRYEPEGLNGISHLIEHILFREDWWPPYDNEAAIQCDAERDEIFNQIRSSGGILNGSTTFEYTRYYVTAPASEFKNVLGGLSRLVLEPCFNRRGINLEKKVILHEIAFTKNNPFAIAYYSLINRVIPDNPLGRPIAGTTLSIKTISFDRIREFYQTYYIPNNMTVVIVGGIDTEIALSEVEKIFSNKEKSPLPDKSFSIPHFKLPKSPFYKGGKRGIKLKTLTKQGYFALIVRTDGEKDIEKHAMRLLYSILGPGKNSRLYHKLKEEGLSDFFISAEDFGLQELASLSDIGIWGFVIGTHPDNLKRLEEIVLSEIEKMKSTPTSEDELTIAKSETIGKLRINFESNEFRASIYIHWSVSGSSGRTDRNVCPTIDTFLQEIDKISTEQITCAVKEHFKDDRLLVVTVMPAKGLGIIWAAIKFLLFKRI
ncbi:MAG TPA: M16 family metallopeptidase [Candidatus Brocadiia bacterium]|nr:pitrilysin family protein [Candidatus Brocadiales bacterium]